MISKILEKFNFAFFSKKCGTKEHNKNNKDCTATKAKRLRLLSSSTKNIPTTLEINISPIKIRLIL